MTLFEDHSRQKHLYHGRRKPPFKASQRTRVLMHHFLSGEWYYILLALEVFIFVYRNAKYGKDFTVGTWKSRPQRTLLGASSTPLQHYPAMDRSSHAVRRWTAIQ